MKYVLLLTGFIWTATFVWAAPEEMTMYATLSSETASFWEVETRGSATVMPEGSTLNLGMTEGEKGTENGVIKTDLFSVDTLSMDSNDTKLQVGPGVKWYLTTLRLGRHCEPSSCPDKPEYILFKGDLIVNQLTIQGLTNTQTRMEIYQALALGSDFSGTTMTAPNAQFSRIEVGTESGNKFLFDAADSSKNGTAKLDENCIVLE